MTKTSQLIVKLPFVKDLKKTKVKTRMSTAERVRNYRRRQKEANPDLYKSNKKKENKAYKAKLKDRVKVDTGLKRHVKYKRKVWNRRYQEKKKIDKSVSSKVEQKRKTIQKPRRKDPSATTRKRAQRIRQHLPESPGKWCETIEHIVHNATPRKKSRLATMSENRRMSKDNIETNEVLNDFVSDISKPGRTPNSLFNAKQKLMSKIKDQPKQNTFISKNIRRHANRYLRRRRIKNRKSASQKYHEDWRPKIHSFLDEHSRIMPNKKDTMKVNGLRVPKRHLLLTKMQTYRKFKERYPDYKKKYTTFVGQFPKTIKRLKMSNRRVCVCLKDYNLEQKVLALNKIQPIPSTILSLSEASLCKVHLPAKYPEKKCIQGKLFRLWY